MQSRAIAGKKATARAPAGSYESSMKANMSFFRGFLKDNKDDEAAIRIADSALAIAKNATLKACGFDTVE